MMYFRASNGIMRFLSGVRDKDFSGQLAAAFDTQMPTWFSGNATKGIENKLKKLVFEIVAPTLIA